MRQMLKKVKLRIESVIENLSSEGLPDGDPEKSVSECFGSLHITDSRVSVTYTEKNEGGEIRSEIICIDGSVTVIRSGAIESELCFIEGETHRSIYSIPPYKFDAEIKAKRVRVDISETNGSIDLLYNMTVGGAEKAARMKIWISQASKQV
jgi:uncharacterized beta-barrel protein YwiB (DUF1934 family)